MSSRRRRAVRRAHANLYGHGYGVGGGMAVRYSYQPDPRDRHRDRRRDRRMRRRYGHRGHGGGMLLPVLIGVVIGLVVLGQLAYWLLEMLWPVAVVLVVGAALFVMLRQGARGRTDSGGPAPVAADPPVTGEQAWQRARDGFARVRDEYAAHECDPMAVLRTPALSDVSVPSTARFVDSFAEAQALDTDTYPGEEHGTRYVGAVDRARRAWTAARDAADRIRLSGLTPEERASVERVLKLLTTARDSDSEPERLAAYARARTELDRLDRAGVVHLPRTARAALDEASRGVLPG